ncbi:hypothetical protein [Synechococcus sp. CBW1006]|uniref:hypothetical protein n=1 Tax=Synechococcus sp. CBW1006 TaxID=1353138 RepID=UPI0018CE661C|nr:hypothetical protein [Synechococcus sp. CBW1006]QPN65815.1 hypothetical protein H8F26_13055 [Synechococcus sp. CBW1006]
MATTIDQFAPTADGESFDFFSPDGTNVSGSFDADTNTQTATISNPSGVLNEVGVQIVEGTQSTTIFDGKTVNSTFNGNDESNTVTFTGKVKDSSVVTGDGNDIIQFDKSVGGDFEAGEGDDTLESDSKVKNTNIDMGNGDDSLVFGGTVRGASISGGDGADSFEFFGKIKNTTVDLGGNDGSVDTIRISNLDDIKDGFIITGAEEGDLLIIGDQTYNYDPTTDSWTSPDDTLRFN